MDAGLADLIARARAADGSPPFSDGALTDLAQGTSELVRLGEAAAVLSGSSAEFVVDPDARRNGHGTRMLELLIARGARLFWAHGDHPAARALATTHRLEPVRELLHLEAAVPPVAPKRRKSGPESADSGHISASEGAISVISEGWAASDGFAAFTLADADEWLALNARAFAAHPEQGGVTRADLELSMGEPWFDAEDFLLLRDDDGTLIGYNWLKVEGGPAEPAGPAKRAEPAREGEFYVVGVSPGVQGRGLGRRLVEAGFARLASTGIHTAHLYVEGDNAPALALYRRYGFTIRSQDVQYAVGAQVKPS